MTDMQTPIEPHNQFDFLYINCDNEVMGRFDRFTYTKDPQGTMIIQGKDLSEAKQHALAIAKDIGITPSDIIISLNHKELKG